MRQVAENNPNATVLVRAVRFSSGAAWHVATPTPVGQFQWNDLTADGVTDLGEAMRLVADQLRMPPMEQRALPPVLVLISDGQPTDNWEDGLRRLQAQPWGKKAVRVAVAIGEDADHDVLQQFIGNRDLRPLQANNPEALVHQIRWVSTAVLQSASSPASMSPGSGGFSVPLPLPPPAAGGAPDVW
jgi:uncharacterized protein YegL